MGENNPLTKLVYHITKVNPDKIVSAIAY